MSDLAPAVRTVIEKCLAVTAGGGVGGVAAALLMVMAEGAPHGTEPPPAVAAALAACDVFIAPTSKSLSHTSARKRATDNGARGATMPGVTEDMLARVMAVDFDPMAARSKPVADLLDRGTRAYVTCRREPTCSLRSMAGL